MILALLACAGPDAGDSAQGPHADSALGSCVGQPVGVDDVTSLGTFDELLAAVSLEGFPADGPLGATTLDLAVQASGSPNLYEGGACEHTMLSGTASVTFATADGSVAGTGTVHVQKDTREGGPFFNGSFDATGTHTFDDPDQSGCWLVTRLHGDATSTPTGAVYAQWTGEDDISEYVCEVDYVLTW